MPLTFDFGVNYIQYCRKPGDDTPKQVVINGVVKYQFTYWAGTKSVVVNYDSVQEAKERRCITAPSGDDSLRNIGEPIVESGPPDQFYPAPEEPKVMSDLVIKGIQVHIWRLELAKQAAEANRLLQQLKQYETSARHLQTTLSKIRFK